MVAQEPSFSMLRMSELPALIRPHPGPEYRTRRTE